MKTPLQRRRSVVKAASIYALILGVANGAWRGWWRVKDMVSTPGAYVAAIARDPDKLDIFVVRYRWRRVDRRLAPECREWCVAGMVVGRGRPDDDRNANHRGLAALEQAGRVHGWKRRRCVYRRVGVRCGERRLARLVACEGSGGVLVIGRRGRGARSKQARHLRRSHQWPDVHRRVGSQRRGWRMERMVAYRFNGHGYSRVTTAFAEPRASETQGRQTRRTDGLRGALIHTGSSLIYNSP